MLFFWTANIGFENSLQSVWQGQFIKVNALLLVSILLFVTTHRQGPPPPPNQTSSYGMNIQISCYAVRVVHLAGVLQQLPTWLQQSDLIMLNIYCCLPQPWTGGEICLLPLSVMSRQCTASEWLNWKRWRSWLYGRTHGDFPEIRVHCHDS